MSSRMPLITCYAKLNFYFSDLRSPFSRRDTNNYAGLGSSYVDYKSGTCSTQNVN